MGDRKAPSSSQPLVTLDDYESAARSRIDSVAWEYIASGAADEMTLAQNRSAYGSVRLVPRVLRDVSSLDTSVRLLGEKLQHPILLAPVAANVLAHRDGEVAAAQGARAAGAGMILSSYTSRRIEEVAAAGVRPLWFQLYMQERTPTRELLPRAVDAGCTAIVVTVDTPTSGSRDRQARAGFEFPADLPYRTVEPGSNPCTWEDIAWIRDEARVPVFLKGILHPDDAELAVAAGVAGIVVSNHGARNLDTTPATIEVLPQIAKRVDGRLPLLLDGGIRRGTDVLKALALGATAVCIGRPYVHGLAVDGAAGVQKVVEILRRELELAMALTGCRSVADVSADLVWHRG